MIRAAVWMAWVALAFVAVQAARADYEAGRQAWEAGQLDEALAQWRVSAESGDRRAMLALGRLHVQGLGVLQDYVQAHVWFNLAASRGEAAALDEREAVAAKMTPEQVARAQKLAPAWRPGADEAAVAGGAPGASGVADAPVAGDAEDAGSPPPRAIRETQRLLAALGYRPGPADGIWGARTGRAYRSFLRDAGLPAEEVVTPSALRALREIAARQGAVAEPDRAATAGGTTQSSRASDAARRPAAPDALHLAAQAGDIDGLKAALTAGVEVNAPDAQGWTALMHAVNKGYPLLIDPLLSAGANPDVRAPDGATALFIAALHGYSEIIAQLLRAGADISIPGPKDRTPLDVARNLKHLRVLALPEVVALKEAQARREREEAERRKREEDRQRAEEKSGAFAQAQAWNSPPAYSEFLSAWCPGGKLCATARSRLDESVRASIAGKTFSGINSNGDEQRYEFLPSGKVDGVVRPSSWTRAWGSGTWEVGGGRIRVVLDWAGGAGRTVSEAEFDGMVLTGREQYTREGVSPFFGAKNTGYTWRLTERTATENEAESAAATRKRTDRSNGK